MIDLPLKDNQTVNKISSELLAIKPNIEISYEYGYKGLAQIFLLNDFDKDRHHMFIKSDTIDAASLIHEMLHIKYGYENRIKWKEDYVDNHDNVMIQMYICFSSMRDHYRIHNFLVGEHLIDDEECWKSFINSGANDSNYMSLYCLCNCINEAGQYLNKYKKKLVAKIPNTYRMAIEIMRNHDIKRLNTDESIIMDIRRKITRLCKLVPYLQSQYKFALKMPYFFADKELNDNVKKNVICSSYKLKGSEVIGLFHKNDYIPFEIYEYNERIIKKYNENTSLKSFLSFLGKLWWA